MCTLAYRQALINQLYATASATAGAADEPEDPVPRAAASPASASIPAGGQHHHDERRLAACGGEPVTRLA
jgi:hypothetical protein